MLYAILLCLLAVASSPAQQIGTVVPRPFSASRAGGHAVYGGLVVAPGQIVQVLVTGGIPSNLNLSASIPYPTKLGGVSAKVQQANGTVLDVPLIRVSSYAPCGGILTVFAQPCQPVAAVTLQMPYGMLVDTPFGELHQASALVFFKDDSAVASALITPLTDAVSVLTNCGPGGPQPASPCGPLVTHADGAPGSARAFAAGETVVIYATGLGKINASVADGAAPAGAATTVAQVWIDFNFRANALAVAPPLQLGIAASDGYAAPAYAGATPGYPGLYQVNVQLPSVPAGTPACGGKVASNLTITVIGVSSFDAAPTCVAAQP